MNQDPEALLSTSVPQTHQELTPSDAVKMIIALHNAEILNLHESREAVGLVMPELKTIMFRTNLGAPPQE